MSEYDLTDEQIAEEQKLMEGVMPISIGALLIPPIWGPAHGQIVTILFYPAWVFVDNLIYGAIHALTVRNIIFAVIALIVILGITLIYGRLGSPWAARRAASKGMPKEKFLRSEKIWAIVGVVFAIVVLMTATYYNLQIRPFM